MDYSNKTDFWDFIGRAILNLDRWGSGLRVIPHDVMIHTIREMADDLLGFCTMWAPSETATVCEKIANVLATIRDNLSKEPQLTSSTKHKLKRASHFLSHVLSGDFRDFNQCHECCTKCPEAKPLPCCCCTMACRRQRR